MPLFRDVAIKTKLQRVVALTTVIALALACIAIITFQYRSYRQAAVHSTGALAKIIAANTAAALSFHDAAAAREILEAFATNPEILSARIYTPDGQVFAEYVRAGAAIAPLPLAMLTEGYLFDGNCLLFREPIKLGHEVLGMVGLRSDMQVEIRQLQYSILIVVGCMGLATLAALGLATRLQRFILDPILHLADTAQRVAKTRDYSLRAAAQSRDEVGALTGTFNDMLEQIQQRDREVSDAYEELAKTTGHLQTSEERFRQLAENVHEVFWMTDVAKAKMLYISPAYETVWGRSCESLTQEPMTWVDAIHPDDREPVLAALPEQVEGTYDVEYRIRRTDGSERWIHDRAFPVRDVDDKVYRLAGIAEDITERKQAEMALRSVNEVLEQRVRERTAELQESEGRLRLALEASKAGVWSWDAATTIGQWDEQYRALYGFPAEGRITDDMWFGRMHPDNRERLMQANQAVAARGGGTVWNEEFRIEHPTRGVRWLAELGRIERDSGGWVVRTAGITFDITERKLAEEQIRHMNEVLEQRVQERTAQLAATNTALRKSETRLEQTIQAGNVGLWDWDLATNQVTFSTRWKGQIGYGDDEISNDFAEWQSRVHPDDLEPTLQQVRAAIAAPVPNYHVEFRFRHKDGSYRWILAQATVLRDSAGKAQRMLGSHVDITDRKQAEAAVRNLNEVLEQRVRERTAELAIANTALLESEGRLRLALEASKAGVWSWDAATNIATWDVQYRAMYGFGADEPMSHAAWLERIHPADRQKIQNRIRMLLEPGAGEVWNEDFRVLHPTKGTRWMTGLGRVDRDATGRAIRFAGINLDMTERKQIEERLRLSLEASQAGVWSWDAETDAVKWDEQYRLLYGFELHEPVSKETWLAKLHPDDFASVSAKVNALHELHGPEIWNEEFRIVHPVKGVRWMAEMGRIEHDADGRIISTAGITFDITERKQVEEQIRNLNVVLEQRVKERTVQLETVNSALRAQQQEQQTILDSVPSFIWYKDCHNRILRINHSAAAAIGKTVAEVEGRPTEEFYPDEAGKYHADDLEVIRSGKPKFGIIELVPLASGKKRWVQTDKVPFRDERGELIGIIVCATDITQLKEAKVELQIQGEIMQNMAEGAVLVRAADGVIVYANPSFERMFGYARGEMNGQPVAIVNAASDQDPQTTAKKIMDDIQRAGHVTYEVHNRRKDGTEFWCLATASTYTHPLHGAVLVAVHADITERRAAEQKVRAAEAKYRMLVERVPSVTYTAELGEAGRWQFVSPQVEPLLGFSPEEWMTDPGLWYRQVVPEDRSLAMLHDEIALRTGQFDAEYRMATRDGRIIWIRDVGALIQSTDGSPPVIQGILREITARKQAELALRASEKQYRQLLDTLQEGIWASDVNAVTTFVNPRMAEMLGYDVTEMVGQSLYSFVNERTLPEFRHHLALRPLGVTEEYELEFRHKSGRAVSAHLHAGPLQDAEGKFIGSLAGVTDVTASKQAELDLRESEERYRQLVEQAPDAIGVAVDGKIAFINSQGVNLLGAATADQLLGRPFAEFVHADNQTLILERVRTVLETHAPAALAEYTLVRVDGTTAPVEVTATFVTYQGRPAVQAVIRDVTARQQAEAALRASEENYRRLVNTLQEGLCVTDANGVVTFVNPRMAEMVGYRMEELVGQPVFRTLDEAGVERVKAHLARRRQGLSDEYEHELLHKDGRRIAVIVHAVPLMDDQGRYLGALASMADITARKLAEKIAQESQDRLQAVMDNAPAPIYVKAADGKYLLINRRYETLFNVTRAAVVGKTDYDLFPRTVADEFRKNDLRVLGEKKPIQFEEVAPQADGLHTYISVKFPFLDAAGEPYASGGISTDITERHQLQRQVLEVSDREQRRIGQDLHDGLCQLLTGTAFAGKALEERLAAKGMPEVKDVAEIIELVQHANGQARNIARGLYPIELQSGGLVSALRELAYSFGQLYKIDCRFQCEPGFAMSESAQAIHIYRIVQEALTNAVKHGHARQVSIQLAQDNGTLALCVSDNGRGLGEVPADHTGMGLNIMAYRARMIGGTVQVHRGSNGGAVVEMVCAAG